jgi:hypothetical protein
MAENNLAEFYNALEQKADFKPIYELVNAYRDFDNFKVSIELYASSLKLIQGFRKFLKTDDVNRINVKDYLVSRIKVSQNSILKASYYYLLSNMDNSYLINAYVAFVDVFQGLMLLKANFSSLRFCFEILIELSHLVVKSNNAGICEDFVSILHGLLKDANITQHRKIDLLWLIKSNTDNRLKASNFTEAPDILHNMYNDETDNDKIIRICDFGAYFCSVCMEIDKDKYSQLKKDFLEKQGDAELKQIVTFDPKTNDNIMLPHLRHHKLMEIFDLYKSAGCSDKMDKIEQLQQENIPYLEYLRIPIDVVPDDMKPLFNAYMNIFENYPISKILKHLATFGFNIMNIGETCGESNPHYYNEEMLATTNVDIAGNHHTLNDEEIKESHKYDRLYIIYQLFIDKISKIILDKIVEGEFSYDVLKDYLCNETDFGKTIFYNRDNIDYKLFYYIDQPLKALCEELEFVTKQQPHNFCIPIQMLSINIEGIIREIFAHNKITTRKTKNINKQEVMLLDDLLNSPNFTNLFDERLRELLLFALTDKKLNLRNYVGHSMFKPYSYVGWNAVHWSILLLICILGISNFKFIPNK